MTHHEYTKIKSDAWIKFAAGASACPGVEAKDCAIHANELLKEFVKKFEATLMVDERPF